MKRILTFPILVLIIFALIFGVTMVALSLKSHNREYQDQNLISGNDKVYEKSYSVEPGGKLVVDADVGDITVTGGDKNEVAVTVAARGSGENLSRFTVSSSQDGNTVKVIAKLKHKYFNFFGENSPDVHIDVQVPATFNLHLSTSGGDIALDNVKGTIDGETSGGDLVLRKLDGEVRMNTSGGNISLKHSQGNYTLETSGGNIGGVDVNGPIHFETSGGNIELRESDGKVYASTSGGDITVELKDNKGVDLSTSGGNLSVRLPKTIAAEVRAEASGGDVSCDFPFEGKLREGSLRGKINGGGNLIRLETSGGDIVINPME